MKKPTTSPLPAADQEAEHRGHDRRDEDPLVEPDQLGKLVQVAHGLLVVFLVLGREHPADVRPVKALELGGMEIVLGVGMAVVMPVMRRPPERALLRRAAPEKGEAELEEAAGLVAAMGKVAVERAGDAELAGEEHEGAQGGSLPADAGPEHGQAGQMDQDEERAGERDTKASMHISAQG